MSILEFSPPLGLGHGHVQTIIGSSLRKIGAPGRARGVCSVQRPETLTAEDGTRLMAWVSEQNSEASGGAPMVVIIHGWLGTHNSGYNLSLAEHLWQNGFSVARLNLRDHGGTTHLNEGMFHNGRLQEVVDVLQLLKGRYPTIAVAGFSLGGNFALRLAKALDIPALGICPLMDPAASVATIDDGWTVYKTYFMRKWLKALDEKSAAFPDTYRFRETGAYDQKTVHDMTAHFVEHHTDYPSLQDYYDCYTLTGDFLEGVNTSIIAAADDPVVPVSGFSNLPDSVSVKVLPRGGHCAFIDSYKLTSFVDRYAVQHFRDLLQC